MLICIIQTVLITNAMTVNTRIRGRVCSPRKNQCCREQMLFFPVLAAQKGNRDGGLPIAYP